MNAVDCKGVGVVLDGQTILDGVEIAVQSGEWLGLIGPNGAGKSTLLRAAAGLVGYDGTIEFAGDGDRRATQVALVPQSPLLPAGMTVAEYALIGRTAHLGWFGRESRRDRQVVHNVLERLDLDGFADREVTSLSGGESQRVVLARALAQQAPVLLLDEPTSALDVGHRDTVLDLLDDLRREDGLTVFAAMHDLTTAARYSDRLALLDRGRLIRVGPTEEVIDSELLSSVYGVRLDVHHLDGELVVVSAPRRARKT